MDSEHYNETRKVTLVGAFVDFVLGVAKIAAGVLSHSQGLIADGVHSLSDLVTDGLVIWAAKHATQKADLEHPYGHERIETATTVLLGIALITVALGIAYDSVSRLFDPQSLIVPGKWAAAVAIISILAKEWIYHYTKRTAQRIRSRLLHANAWHSRSDALSSVVVLIGIVGAMAGVTYLDVVAAIIVAAMIIHVGWRLGWDSIHELIDTGLDKSRLENMRQTMLSVEGVSDIHQLRTRRMGHQVLADVHVLVDPLISVSEGHRISEEVERALYDAIDEPTDVTVHIDCEQDEASPPALLPLRHQILPVLRKNWAEISDIEIRRVTLHYLDDKVRVEIWLNADETQDMSLVRQLEQQMQQKLEDNNLIGSVNVVLSLN